VWATTWLAFGAQYQARAYYLWGSDEVDASGSVTKTERTGWRAGLDGFTVSGTLFF
jgi:hypothetical protein